MNGAGEFVYDVDASNFMEKVVEESNSRVVVVDFWADWCGPCKMLGPVLEKVVASYNGRVALAKVDVDANQQLASQFGIRSIPSVKIIKDGGLAGEFVGAKNENEIRALLDPIAGSEEEDALAIARKLAQQGDEKKAAELYRSLIDEDPDNHKARLELARLELQGGSPETARQLLESIPEGEKEYDEARSILSLFEFSRVCFDAGGFEQANARREQSPDDLDAAYVLGCCYAGSERYEEACEIFLEIVGKDRNYGDGKAREAMISLFNVLGPESDVTRTYRGKLASILF